MTSIVMALANHFDKGVCLVLGLNMDQLSNKPTLAVDKLARSLNIRLQSKIAVQQSPSNKSKATNSLNNTAKPVPITPVNRTATPMTRQKQRDAKNGTADDSVNESENPSARARCLESRARNSNENANDQAKTARRRQLSRFGPKEEGARLMAATDE